MTEKKALSRREFFKEAGLLTGGAALTSLALSSACNGAETSPTAPTTTGAPAGTTSTPASATSTPTGTTSTPAGTTSTPATSATGTATLTPTGTTGATTATSTTAGPPPAGQYVPPEDYPGLVDTLGCTSKVASDRWYNVDHMWVKELGGGQAVIGISDKFQMLMDTVTKFEFMFRVGDSVAQGEIIAGVEAYKLNTDLYAPVSGKILQVNNTLQALPGTINAFPYTKAWMMVLQMTKPQELEGMIGPNYYAYLQAKEVPKTVPPKRS